MEVGVGVRSAERGSRRLCCCRAPNGRGNQCVHEHCVAFCTYSSVCLTDCMCFGVILLLLCVFFVGAGGFGVRVPIGWVVWVWGCVRASVLRYPNHGVFGMNIPAIMCT